MSLVFNFGTMGSGKTLHLISKRHDYLSKDGKVRVVTPSVDTRYGAGVIKSRTGLECKADIILPEGGLIQNHIIMNPEYEGQKILILVDEVQFMKKETIDSLRHYVDLFEQTIECFGLRTDFRGDLFEGSKRLLEVADQINHIPTLCTYCSRPAIFNLRIDNFSDDQVVLGAEDIYREVCSACYYYEMEGE